MKKRDILMKSRFCRIRRLFGIFVAGWILQTPLSAPCASPQEPQTLTKPLQYEVSVVLKLIHVYVTDKKGNPVRDLAKEDFVIVDSGNPVSITDFEKHMLSASPKESVPEKPAEAAAQGTALEAPVVRQATRKFFLFFDMAFNNSRGIAKAKKAAFHFLDTQVRPEDEVGVVSYSMFGGVKVHEFLTADRSKIRDAVAKLSQRGSMGRAEEIGDWYWRLVQEPLPREGGVAQGESESTVKDPYPKVPYYVYEAKAQQEEVKRLSQAFILALTTLAKALRYIPDQKQFILFSSGVPSSLIYGTQAGNPSQTTLLGGGSQFDAGDSTLKAMNEAMYREFAVSRCTFYTFDTRESAKGMDLFGYDNRTFETGRRSLLNMQSVFQDSNSIFKDDKVTGRSFLKRFSDVTGGQYFSNIDRYEKNLDEVQGLTGTYYVLGYPINEKWDGSYHEVKVEVKRKGCEVRAQAGYFNPKPFSEYSDLEKQLHLFDLALNERAFSRMPLTVPMRALTSAAEGISRLAVLAKVPGEVTAKLTGKRVEFVAIFFDEKGEISDMVREETDPASLRGQAIVFTAGSTLKPGDYSCRLVIRDMDTGLSAVASTKATVGKPAATSLQLGTPLILAEGTGCFFLDAGGWKVKGAIPFGEVYPYDKTQFSPLLTELPMTVAYIQVIIPFSVPGGVEPDLALSAYLVNSTSGEQSPVTFSRTELKQNGRQKVLTLELPITGFAPGTYFIHFNAEDRASKSLGHTYATLVIPQR